MIAVLQLWQKRLFWTNPLVGLQHGPKIAARRVHPRGSAALGRKHSESPLELPSCCRRSRRVRQERGPGPFDLRVDSGRRIFRLLRRLFDPLGSFIRPAELDECVSTQDPQGDLMG